MTAKTFVVTDVVLHVRPYTEPDCPRPPEMRDVTIAITPVEGVFTALPADG